MKSLRYLLLVLLFGGCAVPPIGPGPLPDRPIYPGFDVWRYPGDDLILAWRDASPYRWIGYYLPAPCHRAESFVGRRQFLTNNGWGTAIIYVGQQLFEAQTPAEITPTTVCSSQLLTADRGVVDGRDAITATSREGFPPGSVIFLDVERMDRIAPQMVEYYQAWIRTVLEEGTYRPGTYAHIANAAGLYSIAQSVLRASGSTQEIPFWIAGGSGFTLESPPEAVGYRFASIWQGVLDTQRTWGGRSLVIDENVARHPSPSAPDAR